MNLEDIAHKAGVSRSTVSRVINGEPYVSDKTRRKVMAIIEQEGFAPNPAARMLVTQRTNVIGVVLANRLDEVFSAESPFYFATLLQGISDVTHERDYAMLMWIEHSRENVEQFNQRIIKNRMMDGLVLASSIMPEDTLLRQLVKSEIPFVLLGRPFQFEDRISYVSVDNVAAAQQTVQHLIAHGRRRIGLITGHMENVDAQDRLLGYRRAMRAAGLADDAALIAEGRFSRDWGYSAAQQLIRQRVDAIFAGNDAAAMGAVQAIQAAGLRVPDDIAVIGFDDLPIATQLTPTLTTVRQPIVQKGARAATLLIDLIEGRAQNPTQILLPTQLIIRESCGTA